MGSSKKLSIDLIRIDGGTQMRAEIDQATVDEYAAAWKAKAEFPPVVVFFDSADYWLADGNHRTLGAKAAGLVSILADVRKGTQREAILFAAGANRTHGLRRTNADKRKAVNTLLDDPDWGARSSAWIAGECGVSDSLVESIRNERRQHTEKDVELRIGQDGKTRKPKQKSESEKDLQHFRLVLGTDGTVFEGDFKSQKAALEACDKVYPGAPVMSINGDPVEGWADNELQGDGKPPADHLLRKSARAADTQQENFAPFAKSQDDPPREPGVKRPTGGTSFNPEEWQQPDFDRMQGLHGEMRAALVAFKKSWNEAKGGRHGAYLQVAESRLHKAYQELWDAVESQKPERTCPKCDAAGCKFCAGTGWLSKFQASSLPKGA